jgi:hypothetical protein
MKGPVCRIVPRDEVDRNWRTLVNRKAKDGDGRSAKSYEIAPAGFVILHMDGRRGLQIPVEQRT